VQRFNFKNLSELEVRKQYHFRISNRSAAFENLRDDEGINMVGKTLKRISKPHLKRI
jgi:hypothetical protein